MTAKQRGLNNNFNYLLFQTCSNLVTFALFLFLLVASLLAFLKYHEGRLWLLALVTTQVNKCVPIGYSNLGLLALFTSKQNEIIYCFSSRKFSHLQGNIATLFVLALKVTQSFYLFIYFSLFIQTYKKKATQFMSVTNTVTELFTKLCPIKYTLVQWTCTCNFSI